MFERTKRWQQRLLEDGTNIAVSSKGNFEIHTVVRLPGGLSLVLNDAYWGGLCVCEVNRLIGGAGKTGLRTVSLFTREPGDRSRISGLPDRR